MAQGVAILIEEQQRGQGLILGAGRDVAFNSQMGQELLHLRGSHQVGMPDSVKTDLALGQ